MSPYYSGIVNIRKVARTRIKHTPNTMTDTNPRSSVANIVYHMVRHPKWNDLYMGGLNEIARRNPSLPVMDWTFAELFALPEKGDYTLLENFLEMGYLRLLCKEPYIRDHLTDDNLETFHDAIYVVQTDMLDELHLISHQK